ncbi:MAG: glycosyltransferase [Bryobacteraceae bacterium]
MPTYNQVPFLRRAVHSLLAQTCEKWELLIIDDGSTDGHTQRDLAALLR